MLLGTLSLIVVQKTEIVSIVHILFSSKSKQNKTNSELLFIDKRTNTYKGASSNSVLSLKGPDLQYREETEIFVV